MTIRILSLLVPALALAAEAPKGWEDTLVSDHGSYSVSVQPDNKKVEIKKVGEGQSKNTPRHLRVRLLRENDRPLELRLRTVEKPGGPLYYTGQIKQWNESVVGMEVDFSFDKKTWKRLGKTIRKALP